MDFFPFSALKGEGCADMSKRIHSDFIPNWSQSFSEFQVLGDKIGVYFLFSSCFPFQLLEFEYRNAFSLLFLKTC